MDLKEIIKEVEKRLSEKRFYHSMCVMERCEELAKKYNADVEIAKKIGIAHDVAKELTKEEQEFYINKYKIQIDQIEKENRGLLHAKIGEKIVINEFGFSENMGVAIKAHTTGIPNMDIFAKILFIADRTSKDRNFDDLELLNNILEKSLDEAVLYIIDKKIKLQIERKNIMHINSIITRNEFIRNLYIN